MTRPEAPLLIDTDNALGSRSGDVDDGLAVAALLRCGVPVAALSSVGGNSSEAEADRNNRALGALCGYPGPYLRGNQVADHLDLWAPVRVLALGPLTNIAAALPALRSSATEVVVVGGNISSRGRFPPFWPHEFNLTKDREAAHAVFASDLPLTIVPLDVARRLRVGKPELARLEGALGHYIRQHSERWLRRSRWLHGPGGFSAFDLLAAATVFAPAAVSSEETTTRAHANLWLEFGMAGRPVRLVRDFDGAAILERFESLINSSLPLLPQLSPQ